MEKIRAIVIEDEPRGMENILWKLEKYCPEIEVLAACLKAEEGITAIKFHRPDVLFLDIRLDSMNGFELLERLKYVDFEVIFTTSFDEYAIEAFRVSALDFLQKPIDEDELKGAVLKARRRIGKQLVKLKRIPFPDSDGFRFLETDLIIHCEADDNYTNIYSIDENRPLLVCRTLTQVEQKLPNEHFLRVHRSHLINLNHVKKYKRGDGGYVIMANDKTVNVSRKQKDEFLRRIEGRL